MPRKTLPTIGDRSTGPTARPLTPFGKWLADQLNERQWSQWDLHNAIGKDDRGANVSNWLYRPRKPSFESCVLIALALDVPLWDVMDAAGHDTTDARRCR